jgi:membrane fusion protein (multidrug efflux system)
MMKLHSALTCVGLAALALVATGCGKSAQQQQQNTPPPEVGVIAVQPRSMPLERSLVGRLSPYRSADVRARVPGVVQERVYEEGSDVEQGAILFRIDPAPLQAALSAALATLSQTQATYTNNHVAAERARELVPKGFVSRADRDNAEAAERSAGAAVKQAKANVESARINLGYATVRAPISGRAGKQEVTEGALVGQGDATLLTTIDQIDQLYVNFTISVADLEKMRQARASGHATLSAVDQAEVRLSLSNGSAYDHAGTMNFSDAAVDPATGAVRLRAQIPNPDHVLLPGMYVTIVATLGEQTGMFSVPQAAVQRDAAGPFVLVVGTDGKVVQKKIATEAARDGEWIVSDGLAAGDQVIVSGLQRARPGEPAKPTPWQPPAAPDGTPAADTAAGKQQG